MRRVMVVWSTCWPLSTITLYNTLLVTWPGGHLVGKLLVRNICVMSVKIIDRTIESLLIITLFLNYWEFLLIFLREYYQFVSNNKCVPVTGGCEGVCVQSMDGQISFYTRGSHSFSCFLPDFLLPGPLAYAPRTDSLITLNSAHILQVFRYETLAVVGGAGKDTGKKFTVSVWGWVVCEDM